MFNLFEIIVTIEIKIFLQIVNIFQVHKHKQKKVEINVKYQLTTGLKLHFFWWIMLKDIALSAFLSYTYKVINLLYFKLYQTVSFCPLIIKCIY